MDYFTREDAEHALGCAESLLRFCPFVRSAMSRGVLLALATLTRQVTKIRL